MKKSNRISLLSILLIPMVVFAHGPIPGPLTNAPLPPVPGLMDGDDPIIVNKRMAIALGKSLFWDMNAGSDGIACGSCHFHAGADRRIKNQRNTGTKSSMASGQTFEINATGGANQSLRVGDFPLHKLSDPLDRESEVLFNSDDVVSSSGTFSGEFHSASGFSGINDNCQHSVDPVHQVGGVGVRRVEPRNAPTMINAVFNHRNFWDGRANNVFNGSSNWGERDSDAGIWVKINSSEVEKQRLHLINSSLASQAIETIQSDTEMACRDRTVADVGRKILPRRPLSLQNVHPNDSVLGELSYSRENGKLKPGLKTTYSKMIKIAFNQKYWSYDQLGSFGGPQSGGAPYSQMEANFALFFGLALQVYESTLISDQAPIDTAPRGDDFRPVFTDEAANRGLTLFVANHCNLCHAGPLMSTATIVTNSMMLAADLDVFGPKNAAKFAGLNQFSNVVGRTGFVGGASLFDLGFMNTGVANPESDPGVGGRDDFGNPLSFVDQYQEYLVDNNSKGLESAVYDVYACAFDPEFIFSANVEFEVSDSFTAIDGVQQDPNNAGCILEFAAFIPTEAAALANLGQPKMRASTKAAFKMPTLRNVELTGPYMHNGSMATLEDVIMFYFRGGNFLNDDINSFVAGGGGAGGSDVDKGVADIKAFLETFTDDRVRYERAPFDHPQIKVPHGAVGDENSIKPGHPLGSAFAEDEMLIIPAVGANGRTDPLQPFDTFLIQDQAIAETLSLSSKSREAKLSSAQKNKVSNYNENDGF